METILYLFFLIGAFMNFLPQILGYSQKDPSSKLYPSFLYELSSFQYQGAIIASIASTVPIVIEFVLESCVSWFRRFKSPYSEIASKNPNLSKVNYLPFQEVVFLIILPDLILLFWVIPQEEYDFTIGLIGARDTMFLFSFLAYLIRMENRIWTWTSTIIIVISFMIANVLVTIKTQVLVIRDDIELAIAVLLPFFVAMGFFSLIITLLRWIWYLRTCNVLDKSEEMRNNLCSVYAFFYTVFILGDWFIFFLPVVPTAWTSIGVNYLTLYTYLMAGCILMTNLFLNRLTRIDASGTKVN